ncbi:hypothetical protein EV182_003290 [Spiromyces aspiralis]|uniref:Uncharacterized protein n=1 Tax=Spiromyces aspiralis TaxID=68401 RepID=A0ACC1HU15_9FUNG|nr:hypothetical protein EV182_003290 [Spiromyces aspiralis]
MMLMPRHPEVQLLSGSLEQDCGCSFYEKQVIVGFMYKRNRYGYWQRRLFVLDSLSIACYSRKPKYLDKLTEGSQPATVSRSEVEEMLGGVVPKWMTNFCCLLSVRKAGPFGILLTTKHEHFCIQAKSRSDRDEWLKYMLDAQRLHYSIGDTESSNTIDDDCRYCHFPTQAEDKAAHPCAIHGLSPSAVTIHSGGDEDSDNGLGSHTPRNASDQAAVCKPGPPSDDCHARPQSLAEPSRCSRSLSSESDSPRPPMTASHPDLHCRPAQELLSPSCNRIAKASFEKAMSHRPKKSHTTPPSSERGKAGWLGLPHLRNIWHLPIIGRNKLSSNT